MRKSLIAICFSLIISGVCSAQSNPVVPVEILNGNVVENKISIASFISRKRQELSDIKTAIDNLTERQEKIIAQLESIKDQIEPSQ
jgi:hypothetical protein